MKTKTMSTTKAGAQRMKKPNRKDYTKGQNLTYLMDKKAYEDQEKERKLRALKKEISMPIKITFTDGNTLVIKQNGNILESSNKDLIRYLYKVKYVEALSNNRHIIFRNQAGLEVRSDAPVKHWERIKRPQKKYIYGVNYPLKDSVPGHHPHFVRYPVLRDDGKWCCANVFQKGHAPVNGDLSYTGFDTMEIAQGHCDKHNAFHGWTREDADEIVARSMGFKKWDK